MKLKNLIAKGLGTCLLMSPILFLTNCQKEELEQPVAPNTQREFFNADSNGVAVLKDNMLQATAPTSATGYNITKSLPSGYVKNGTIDYTKYVQAAINNNSVVVFPNFPILVS